jgi:hypothetical protein
VIERTIRTQTIDQCAGDYPPLVCFLTGHFFCALIVALIHRFFLASQKNTNTDAVPEILCAMAEQRVI